jgi:GNAT superfamily N-acetyltransferase|tara:strand:+ start:458 stop:1102 length:645 start_codon:yes stop_codon:yes gene_type:complete
MKEKIDLRQIHERPELAKTTVSLFNEQVTFRPLMINDTKLLNVFLTNLSSEIRKHWSPHGFDMHAAKIICAAVATESALRLIAIKQQPVKTRIKFWKKKKKLIIGYFIFSEGVNNHDVTRYAGYGIGINQTDWQLAPCVADDYRGCGLGKLMMKHLLSIAHRLNVRRILLQGGVIVSNAPAIAFYRKFNFRIAGKYMTGENKNRNNYYDMILEL